MVKNLPADAGDMGSIAGPSAKISLPGSNHSPCATTPEPTLQSPRDATPEPTLQSPRDATPEPTPQSPRDATPDSTLQSPRDATPESTLQGPRDATPEPTPQSPWAESRCPTARGATAVSSRTPALETGSCPPQLQKGLSSNEDPARPKAKQVQTQPLKRTKSTSSAVTLQKPGLWWPLQFVGSGRLRIQHKSLGCSASLILHTGKREKR